MSGRDVLSDERIVELVLEGETEVFSELVKRHQRSVYRLGLGFFRNEDDASDFTQDVFVKAYVGLAGFQGRSKFSTWLIRIAYNAAINVTKRSRRFEPLDDGTAAAGLSVEDAHMRAETVRALTAAMAKLPERYAVCLDLYFYEGMGYTEIGDVTGFPVNTIKSHVFRAKQELRDALRREME